MGHTGSVQRGSRRHVHGTLYGEPVGGGSARGQYTPAQMQALYLSRGRPDMAFMSNQALLPEVPEMQQTSTVKNHVNLKKGSLRLAPGGDADRPDRLSLEFEFDATKPCRLSLLVVAAETMDDATGCSSFALVHPHALPVVERHFPEGLGQRFRLGDPETQGEGGSATEDAAQLLLDVSAFQERELLYQPGSNVFPLIIVLEVDDSEWPSLRVPSMWRQTDQSFWCRDASVQEAAVAIDVRDARAAADGRVGSQDPQAEDPGTSRTHCLGRSDHYHH
jgi:hypothetical protein